jgi:branched-chain amino acid transport system substrate-binding protein
MHGSIKGATVLVIMAGLLTACGSRPASTGSSASTSGSSASTSGSAVKIFVTAPLSDPSFAVPEVLSGGQAAAAAINASGGINGHPIQILSCNDQSNPNEATKCADQAASDHVSAVTGFFLFGSNTYAPLAAAKIPVLDIYPVSPQSGTEPDAFPIDAGSFSGWHGIATQLVKTGSKNVALIQCATAACAYSGDIVAAGVKGVGGTITSTVNAPIGAPDFSSYVQKALSSGSPQALVFVGISTDTAKLLLAVQQANFSGPVGTSSNAVTPSLLKSPGTGHLLIVSDVAIVDPETKQFEADMKQYEPSALLDSYSEQTWQAVQGVANALKGKTGTDAAALTAALSASTGLQVEAGVPPINMTHPGPIPGFPRMFNPDVIFYKVQNSQYVATTGYVNPYAN